MEDIKRESGLTNSEIAKGLNNLSDTDFYEVMRELGLLNNIDVKTESLGAWIDRILCEVEETNND